MRLSVAVAECTRVYYVNVPKKRARRMRKEGGRELNRWRYETDVECQEGVSAIHFTTTISRTLFSTS